MAFHTLYWSILTIIDIFAIFFNALLIFLACFKTPKAVKTYTILIINLAVTDCVAAMANFFVQQRMIPGGWSIGYISNGPCTYFNYKVCFLGHNIMASMITHSNYSLFLSFAYRYYVLLKNEPPKNAVILVVFLTYTPSFIQLIFYQFASGNPNRIEAHLQKIYPNYDFTGLVISGVEDIRNVFALTKILQMTLMTIPIYLGIIILRAKIIKKLTTFSSKFSKSTKNLHSQFLAALTYQALIPSIYTTSVFMYILEQFGIYSNPMMEDYIISGLVLIPLFSPISSFIFVAPYRRYFLALRIFRSRQIGVEKLNNSNVNTASIYNAV
ncbi:unnamed protein product [Caenorhabditis angaria]|uniref:G-protein coupled receptors family 1 profile domain-containing protein n=1 Tax=Caenorhabditis angaria TaxID=860376 RepID=A0A9P1N994_9PELO|nr:unnamed protein product [Caenorhabditis angaria]